MRLHRGAIAPAPTLVTSYQTNFDGTENPLRETIWLNGGDFGVWHNVQALNGHACASSFNVDPDDSSAYLDPTKHAISVDHKVTTTVHRATSYNPGVGHESQHFLRALGGASSFRGYECIYPVDGTSGCQCVKWNGAFNDFTVLSGTNSNGAAINDGDSIQSEIKTNVIKMRQNGTQVFTVTDSTYSTGNPGIAFFVRSGATLESYCWDDFLAQAA